MMSNTKLPCTHRYCKLQNLLIKSNRCSNNKKNTTILRIEVANQLSATDKLNQIAENLLYSNQWNVTIISILNSYRSTQRSTKIILTIKLQPKSY